jgi:DNA (cytosine-5)-methyltransferase 1
MIRFSDGFVRYYTILEAKRIQTFPDDYPILGSWTEAMRQLGNAVPVHLGQLIAKSLISKIVSAQHAAKSQQNRTIRAH